MGSGEGSAGIVCARNQTFSPTVMVPRNTLGEVYPSERRTATARLEELPLIAPKETVEETRLVGGYGSNLCQL